MPRIAILVTEQQALFELGCAVELFALPRPELDVWYKSSVVSFSDLPVTATAGISLQVKTVTDFAAFDTLIIPGYSTQQSAVTGPIIQAILDLYHRGGRVYTFCSGAFLLAETGLLDEQSAVTHWRYAQLFQERFPTISYCDNTLYILHERLGTSAGSAAAIDLGLAIIRQDFGYAVANSVARRLVMPAHRDGGQTQFAETPMPQKSPAALSEVLDWVSANLDQAISIDDIANKARLSRRTFDRRFRATLGQSPQKWLNWQRIQRARELLETTDFSIEKIAELSGFANSNTLRHHFRRYLNLPPRKIREQFGRRTD